MNEAKKLKYDEPTFMAVEKENKQIAKTDWDSKKKWHFDTAVVLTWGAVILLTIVFWVLIIKLF